MVSELSIGNVMDLRAQLGSALGFLLYIWAVLIKRFIPHVLLVLFINWGQAKDATGKAICGSCGGYPQWPLQVRTCPPVLTLSMPLVGDLLLTCTNPRILLCLLFSSCCPWFAVACLLLNNRLLDTARSYLAPKDRLGGEDALEMLISDGIASKEGLCAILRICSRAFDGRGNVQTLNFETWRTHADLKHF
jgi:hypothetical protein